jgi:hypothetical protein
VTPFGLTDLEARVMDAICEAGSVKRAVELIAPTLTCKAKRKAVLNALERARKGIGTPYGDRLLYVIKWDRARRGV